MSYVPLIAGLYDLHVLLNGSDVKGSPWEVECEHAETHAASCWISGTGLHIGTAGSEADFAVQLKDRYQNNVLLEEPVKVRLKGPELVRPLVKYQGGGSFRVYYTCNDSGDYTIEVTIDGHHIGDSPYEVNVGPADTYAETSYAEGQGLVRGEVGEKLRFKIISTDIYGNQRRSGGDHYVVSIQGVSMAKSNIRDLNDGTYECTYSVQTSGQYSIFVSLEGVEISGSPYYCDLEPSYTDAEHSYCEGKGVIGCSIGSDTRFTIQSVDRFGNKVCWCSYM